MLICRRPRFLAVTIYHNPRCSKSRATLELIRARGIEPLIIEYLQTPPDLPTLRGLLVQLGMSALELARRNEDSWAAAGLRPDADDEDVITAMLAHPILIERPIVVSAGRAVIGRPPENVNALLDE
jgi:arsenate reductase